MSLIKIENLSFSYYGYLNEVFDNVSFSFDTNWKTGLIGRNGIGKCNLTCNMKKMWVGDKRRKKVKKSVKSVEIGEKVA